jgi:opacity protein-like surface antigen
MRTPYSLIALLLTATSAWAHDEDGRWYVQLGVGAVFSDEVDNVPDGAGTIEFDPGFAAALALGRHFPISERFGLNVEGEAYYQYFTVDEEDLLAIPSAVEDDATALTFFLNGILEWHFTPQFSIYGGGGVGWVNGIDYDAWDSGSLQQVDEDAVAFQGKFGFDYALGDDYDVLLGYRYFRADAIEIEDQISSDVSEIDIGQHVLELGFRWGL